MHQPAILAQAYRRHQHRQSVPFSRRCGRHRDASRAALRLAGAGRDEPLADGAGPVLHRDGHRARGPFLADPVQRRRDDPLAQVGQRHAVGEPGEIVPRQRLVTGHDRGVQPVRLGRPVAYPDPCPRGRSGGPASGQGTDVAVVDVVAAPMLPGGQNSLTHPPVRGLVVHPEGVGGLA
jgi:hypothetical protein